VESYTLLEPDVCAVADKTGEFETAVNREIVRSTNEAGSNHTDI
jgi:hypothetical protein